MYLLFLSIYIYLWSGCINSCYDLKCVRLSLVERWWGDAFDQIGTKQYFHLCSNIRARTRYGKEGTMECSKSEIALSEIF